MKLNLFFKRSNTPARKCDVTLLLMPKTFNHRKIITSHQQQQWYKIYLKAIFATCLNDEFKKKKTG